MIELIQPTVENIGNGSVDVTVDIRSKSRPVKIHHVVLVLKSHIRVRWHVTTRNLRGILDIIVGGTDSFAIHTFLLNLGYYFASVSRFLSSV